MDKVLNTSRGYISTLYLSWGSFLIRVSHFNENNVYAYPQAYLGSYQTSIMDFLFVFPFNLLVTTGYLVDTNGYLVVTSGYLISTTGYFWLLLVTFRYFWFLVLVTTK